MEAINDCSKLIAQSLEILRNAADDDCIYSAIKLLEEALIKLTTAM